jgi:hypothetical protein
MFSVSLFHDNSLALAIAPLERRFHSAAGMEARAIIAFAILVTV